MLLKLKELSVVENTFAKLLNKEVPVKIAYRMLKITGKLLSGYQLIRKYDLELVRKYGAPVKDQAGRDTTALQVPPEKMEVYRKEYETMLEKEIDIGAELIPFSCIEAMGAISPADMSAIRIFIEAPLSFEPTGE
jgi:hypothetical protein